MSWIPRNRDPQASKGEPSPSSLDSLEFFCWKEEAFPVLLAQKSF